MMKSILLMVLLSITIAYSYAQEKTDKHNFTIQQCIEYAKKNNVQVKNALLDIKIQEQVNRGVTSAAYPQLNGSVGYTYYNDIPVQSIPDFISPAVYGVLTHEHVQNGQTGNGITAPGSYGIIPAQFGSKYVANGTLQLQQLLFDGQVFVGLQARNTTLKFQQKAVEVTEESIKVNIYKIYYQLAVSKSQIELLDANIERIEKLLKDVKEIYKNGFAEQLDVDKLTVQLSNLKTEKEKVLNIVEIGYLGLKTLIGMPVKETLTLKDNITYDDIKSGLLTDTASIYKNRKEYQYLELAKKLNEYNIKRYKLSYFPTIAAVGVYGKNAQRNKLTFFEKGDWYTTSYFGLNASISLFDGFSKDSKIKQSKYELQKTNNTIESFKLSVDNELSSATLKFNSAISTVESQKRNMVLAEKVYDQTKKKFEAGTGSNTEINAAETDLKSAQTNYITALYDAVIAKVDFLKATGKLP